MMIACAVLGTTVLAAAFHAVPEQTRALWVTRTTLTSSESIKQMVAAAEAGGFNTLLVQVRARGDAYYAGTIEPRASELAARPSFDPLATVIEQADEVVVMTEPDAVYARSPTLTGATKAVSEPMKASSPIVVRYLSKPS